MSLKSSDVSRTPTGTHTATTTESGAGKTTQTLARALPLAIAGMPDMWPAMRSCCRWRRPSSGYVPSLNSSNHHQQATVARRVTKMTASSWQSALIRRSAWRSAVAGTGSRGRRLGRSACAQSKNYGHPVMPMCGRHVAVLRRTDRRIWIAMSLGLSCRPNTAEHPIL
jgi:hypothetical protein